MDRAPTPPTGPTRVLVIGGGFAGLECARELAGDDRFEVTLIDRTNHHLFQPLLYQVATAALAAPDIARSTRQIFAGERNVTVLMDEIVSIDAAAVSATGKSGAVYQADRMLVCVGARTSWFGHDEWEKRSLGLKTLADARAVRRQVLQNLENAELTPGSAERAKLMTVAIIGGGPTGVELAGAFADLVHRSLKTDFRRIDTSTLRVILIEGSGRVLEAYDEDQSEYARRRLEKLGVEVMTGVRVSDIQGDTLHFNDGNTLESAAIIWAAGVAAHPLAATLTEPADRGGRIRPEPDLSLPGHPHVFLAGDIVSLKNEDGSPVPGVAPAAVQMGQHVARILQREADQPGRERPPFRYHDKGMMAIIGKNAAVAKTGSMRLRGFPAWLAWLFIHIAFLVGFRNKLAVLLGWAYAYIRNEPETRIIVGDRDNA
ncbi:MAG: NAD(P)/FAD-dependent oxidoreductase [Akkermansiaceae bacterium]|nr:NAD(P)/FAD-dependent oxidoreductase [Akkermansiaceae bacterium]